MTPDEQRAANREIAEAMGAGWYKWQGRRFLATSEYMAKRFDMNHADAPTECGDDESIPLFSDWDKGIPDIFANTPEGAGARERAWMWLWEHGTRLRPMGNATSVLFMMDYHDLGQSNGLTPETWAVAIAAAFRALKEGE